MGWFRAKPEVEQAARLYALAVAQAREPGFYRAMGVPDSFDGRFEMVALHVYLLVRRLKDDAAPAARALARALVEALFADMDRTFRELGAADLGVGRRVHKTAEAFYGRATTYDAALAAGGTALGEALRRNLYGTLADAPEPVLAGAVMYVEAAAASLAAQDTAALVAGTVRFPAAPTGPAPARAH
jgi:cytochrome b pre-mRNA-processing protein 3